MLARAVGQRLLQASTCSGRCDNFATSQLLWLATSSTLHARSGALPTLQPVRHHRPSSTSPSPRRKSRQSRDTFAREAKVAGLKSRAAFKLLEINDKHRLFQRGDTVVDLGYAPGSWSQVAISKTQPGGRVIGIDIIPSQPPRGVSTIQGDFLSEE